MGYNGPPPYRRHSKPTLVPPPPPPPPKYDPNEPREVVVKERKEKSSDGWWWLILLWPFKIVAFLLVFLPSLTATSPGFCYGAGQLYTISFASNFQVPNLTRAQAEQAVLAGMDEYMRHCGVILKLLPSAGYVTLYSGGTCADYGPPYGYSCALGQVASGGRGIKFQNGTRRGRLDYWSVDLFKLCFMHELGHLIIPGWTGSQSNGWGHSGSRNCVMHIDLAATGFCASEIYTLQRHFGPPVLRKPVFASRFFILSSGKMEQAFAALSQNPAVITPLTADLVLDFGLPTEPWLMRPITGAWNGRDPATQNRLSSVGLYTHSLSQFDFRYSLKPDAATASFAFGPVNRNLLPLAGDWEGEGRDSCGLYDQSTSTFYLRNTLTSGVADVEVQFGVSGKLYQPLVGDFDDDGVDTVCLYDSKSGEIFLRNSNTPGPADVKYSGLVTGPEWVAFCGKFGDGGDLPCFYNRETGLFGLYKRSGNSISIAYINLGMTGLLPICGDFDADGISQIGLYSCKHRIN